MSEVASAAVDFVKNAPGKIKNYVDDIGRDPNRLVTAVGTLGATELMREVKQAQPTAAPPKLPKPPPSAAPPAAAPEPSLPDVADSKGPDRGRASTILTGARGLDDEPTTARRTLLGV